MNKSKFLKKSLAAVLAVLMIVAMIPLSAAAAYEPTAVKPVVGTGFSGTVTGSGYNWEIAFNYNATNTPKVTIETGHKDDVIHRIKLDGSEDNSTQNAGLVATGGIFTLERDANNGNAAVPFRFYVTNSTVAGTEKSEIYTVKWTMGAPAGSASVKSAKLQKLDSSSNVLYETTEFVVDETAKTITFTVPFGYKNIASNTHQAVIEFNGCTDKSKTESITGTVGTNEDKATATAIKTTTEDALTDVAYDIFVVEEEGLKSIKIGDYEGVFKMKASPNQDYQDGNIEFAVPADFSNDSDGDSDSATLKLVPTFEVGSHYSAATLQTTGPANTKIVSGEKFDFTYMLAQGSTGASLILTSITGCTRTYTLKFVPNDKDTTLTGVIAEKGSGASGTTYKVEGTINGENINIVIPKEADITKVKLSFTGPKAVTGGTYDPKVQAPSTATADTFDSTGKTNGTNINAVDCTNPVKVLVTAEDGKTQKYYTLTVTKADATELQPTITAAKLVLNKGKDNEYVNNGVVDTPNRTITFTVPHSTLEAAVASGTAGTEYTFAKSQSSFIEMTGVPGKGTLDSATVKDGGLVTVSAGGGDGLTYAVKYVRANPETGKSITNFVLTNATNKNLINYNNNKAFTVTPTGGKFKVTVADDTATLNASFELSKGAKMFKVPGSPASTGITVATDEMKPANDNGVLQATSFDFTDGTAKYFIADEKLATLIVNGDTSVSTYEKIKNKYPSNMVEYTFETKEEAKTGNRLKTISGLDGNITGTIGGANGDEITLTVPYSYRNGKEFFLNFETDEGATLGIIAKADTPSSATLFPAYSGGKVDWNVSTKKIEKQESYMNGAQPADANVAFKITPDGDDYYVSAGGKNEAGNNSYGRLIASSSDANGTTKLAVLAEDGSANKPYYIKEVKVADANTGAEITEAKVNGVTASISQSAETITANVPFGTNLGQVKLALTASKMATVKVNGAVFNADNTYDLRKPAKIEVTSEKGDKVTVYTLTVKTGEQFTDVPANAWFAPYVKEAVDKGIVFGYENGTFKPYDNIQRQDFALMTVRMLGKTKEADAMKDDTIAYSDSGSIRSDAKGAVAYCVANNIINGYTDGTFKPTNTITREEAAKILAVALKLDTTGTSTTFADNSRIQSWAVGYVAACQAEKIFTGDEAKRFNPQAKITRAETAKVMVESLKK